MLLRCTFGPCSTTLRSVPNLCRKADAVDVAALLSEQGIMIDVTAAVADCLGSASALTVSVAVTVLAARGMKDSDPTERCLSRLSDWATQSAPDSERSPATVTRTAVVTVCYDQADGHAGQERTGAASFKFKSESARYHDYRWNSSG
jgi:hypothetical protein